MPSKKAPRRSPSATAIGRMELMYEDIVQKFNILAEGQSHLRSETHQLIGDLQRSLVQRFETLESVVRQNSVDIRKNSEDIRKNSDDIRKNTEDIRKNTAQLEVLTARVDRCVDVGRVERIERHLGIQADA